MIDQLILEGRASEAIGDLLDIMEEMNLPKQQARSMLPSQALMQLRSDER